MRVTFQCDGLNLEGDLTAQAGARCAAVICHPHPQYGGDMDNPIVLALTRAFQDAGFSTLRFNFRGVGGSKGAYGSGIGEVADLIAASRYLIDGGYASQLVLAGYSFGAMVTLRGGPGVAAADGLVAVAPPLVFFDLTSLAGCVLRKLFIVGDRDGYCEVARLTAQLSAVPEPKACHVLPGADHFFSGQEEMVCDALRAWVGA